jgi:hypothetical protein
MYDVGIRPIGTELAIFAVGWAYFQILIKSYRELLRNLYKYKINSYEFII